MMSICQLLFVQINYNWCRLLISCLLVFAERISLIHIVSPVSGYVSSDVYVIEVLLREFCHEGKIGGHSIVLLSGAAVLMANNSFWRSKNLFRCADFRIDEVFVRL